MTTTTLYLEESVKLAKNTRHQKSRVWEDGERSLQLFPPRQGRKNLRKAGGVCERGERECSSTCVCGARNEYPSHLPRRPISPIFQEKASEKRRL